MSRLQPITVSTRPAEGVRLVVSFQWTGDRYSHTVSIEVDGEQTPLLRSIEGDDQDHWPASPPIQTVTLSGAAAGDAAMALGMAGGSHWAGSVEPKVEHPAISFDFACRLGKEVPPQNGLGSAYQTASAHPLGEGIVATSYGKLAIRSRDGLLEGNESQIRIRPNDNAARWRYEMHFMADE